MTQLLLSFCYSKPVGHALALFDCESEAFEWIDLSEVPLPVYGATGLCRVGGTYYAALQVRAPGTLGTLLAQFDDTGRLLRTASLAQVHDAHSLLWWHGELLLVSSGTNQVFAIDWAPGSTPRMRVFFEREPGADTLHMNSLQAFDGHVYLSMFGSKPSASWREASDGQVLDLSAGGKVVLRGLQHPHSLFVDGGGLFCMNSRTSAVVHVAGTAPGHDTPLSGYVRGALSHGSQLFVGTSMQRKQSKSRGVSEASDKVSTGTGCGLHVLDSVRGVARWHDLSPFGAELYDVLAWHGRPVTGTRADAMVRRLHAVNSEFAELIGATYRMRQQHGLVAQMLRQFLDAGFDLSPAQALLEQLSSDAFALPEWCYLRARQLLASRADPAAAVPLLQRALDGGYDAFAVLHQLIRAHALLDDPTAAAACAQRALASAPRDGAAAALAELARLAQVAHA
ncbi:MAG: DUF4915 domain-containing protein [Paraburkholderia sp.]